MAKTTAECKVFVTKFFTKNPQLPTLLFGDDMEPDELSEFLRDVGLTKHWKREGKGLIKNGNPYDLTDFMIFEDGCKPNRYGEVSKKRPATDFEIWRIFDFGPMEGGLTYFVLEDKDGNLAMGSYVGD